MSGLNEILQDIDQVKQSEECFNGSISPIEAWKLVEKHRHNIHFIDVRSNEERVFTGYIPDTEHFTWASGTSFVRNPRFVKEVEHKLGKQNILFLFCRSGGRSKLAATALKGAGFEYVYNILEGFEGDLDELQQRNKVNGWKFHQLPWIQS